MRALATWICAVHVLCSTLAPGGLAEVFRLPALADHYELHERESGGALTLAEFLWLHYADPDHNRRDPSHHDILPFHGSGVGASFLGTAAPSVLVAANAGDAIRGGGLVVAEHGQWDGRSIFQPPKRIG